MKWCIQRTPERDYIPELLYGLKHPYSLDYKEKAQIILVNLPNLNQFQIDALIEAFAEEKERFKLLSKKHPEDIKILDEKTREEWKALCKDIFRCIKA